jgi:hypothetical protein
VVEDASGTIAVSRQPGPPVGTAWTVARLRRVLGGRDGARRLLLRIVGLGGAYRVCPVRVWDEALWFEVDRDQGAARAAGPASPEGGEGGGPDDDRGGAGMTPEEIREALAERYPECLLADGFERALGGIVEGWVATDDGIGQHAVACYDYATCVAILVEQGMDRDEAVEFLGYNTLGAYVGPYTPVFLHDWRRDPASPR